MIKPLSLEEAEFIAYALAKELLPFDEPIPDFGTRFPDRLESCLAVPFLTFAGKSPYSGLASKSAILFYVMIKNHPFQNGNKRIALTTLLVFLANNGKWIHVDPAELYNLSMWVAFSPAASKEETVRGVETFINKHLTDFPQDASAP